MKCIRCGYETYNDWDMFQHYKEKHPMYRFGESLPTHDSGLSDCFSGL
jgi:hypothetical protein